MTADAHFNRWMRRALALFGLICTYIFIADLAIPLTPHSMVQRPVVGVAPRVAGEVIDVGVTNNQHVEKGDILFRIDPSDYQIALEKARMALSEARQYNESLEAQLAQARANILEYTVILEENQREYNRVVSLAKKELISAQHVDQMLAEVDAAKARLQAAKQHKHALQIELGEDGDNNLRLRIARIQIRRAELDLSRTVVKAPEAGFVSNLQLTPGIQAQASESLLSLVVTHKERIVADFREKSLSGIPPHAHALVVFDALPGKVFNGDMVSRDFGVETGQMKADGRLAKPDDSDRWVRDAQRVRVYVKLKEKGLPGNLVTGARATVLLQRENSGFFAWLANVQMKIISLLHYVY